MKKIVFKSAMMTLCLTLFLSGNYAQVSHGDATLNKNAEKGLYNGTYALDDGNIALFYESKAGLFAYVFDKNAKFLHEKTGADADALLGKIKTSEEQSELGAIPELKEDIMLNRMNLLGVSLLTRGKLYVNGDSKFIYGLEYDEKEKVKLKTDDIWKTTVIGSRSIMPHKTMKLVAPNGKTMMYTFSESGRNSSAPVSGAIQIAGVVVEKVSIKDPPPYNNNRLILFKTNGKNLDNVETNIHIMPHAMQPVGSGVNSRGNFVALVMPLNAPSTVSEQRKWVASDSDRMKLFIYEADENNQIVNETMMESPIGTVNYQLVSNKQNDFVIGTGNSKGRNWRLFYNGQDMNAIVIARLDGKGNVAALNFYEDNKFTSKVEQAGGGSVKTKFVNGPMFDEVSTLDNGNLFVFGSCDHYHHGLLLSASGELIKYILFPHEDLTKNSMFTYQMEARGNKVYVVITDQPHELTNEVQKSTSSHSNSYTAGGYRITTKTTTTKTTQRFEIYHVSSIHTIDGSNGKVMTSKLQDLYKGFNSLGNLPALFADDGIYFGGRPKADKGKQVAMVKFNY